MKSISQCIRIQIPAIYNKHPFSDIPITEEYFDVAGTGNHIKNLEIYKLIPFFKSVQNLSERFGERFKLAVSISGISLKLLHKHAPNVITEIKSLSDKGVIEFFSEPWSNSIISYYNEQELVKQTARHKQTIETIFGKTPVIFIADTPLNPGKFNSFEPYPGCNTIFTCANQIAVKKKDLIDQDSFPGGKANYLINHTMSKKLQYLASDTAHIISPGAVAPFVRYLRKYVSLVKPLILTFDPLAINIQAYNNWETIITWLLEKTGSSIYSLNDLKEVANYFYVLNDYSDAMLSQFKLPDNWMKNTMQQEAFTQLMNIYKLIRSGEYPYVPEAWDYLQDMNNFFYMSDLFFHEEFANQHFTPYRSPHEAFTNYMNVAANFWNIKKNSMGNYFKTDFLFSPTIN